MIADLHPPRADDLEFLVELEEGGFDPRERWSETAWNAELQAGNRVVLVARAGDGGLLGAISCSISGETAELLRIVVDQRSRRQGLGSALVMAAVDAVAARGATEMVLEVGADNAAALSVYRRHGFVELDRRTGYYGSGTDALVMRRRPLLSGRE